MTTERLVTLTGVLGNRSGVANIDLEFRKQVEHSRFEPSGAGVLEQLIDDRIFVG